MPPPPDRALRDVAEGVPGPPDATADALPDDHLTRARLTRGRRGASRSAPDERRLTSA